jgi:hypothetical protein
LDPDKLAIFALQPFDQFKVLTLALLQLPEERPVDFAFADRGDFQRRDLFKLFIGVTDHVLKGRIGHDEVLIPIKNGNAHERVCEHRAPSLLVNAQLPFQLGETLLTLAMNCVLSHYPMLHS